jgi:ribosomal protein S4E
MTKNVSSSATVKDGDFCKVVGGTHKGKSGIARDLNISKTGHLTITVVQESGERFKALGKNVVVEETRKERPTIRSTRSRVGRAPG